MENLRAIALEILMDYEKEGTKLRPLLLSVLEKNDHLGRDRKAFIKALTEGTVERLITLDWILDQVSKTKTEKMKPVIRMILRLGTYQLVFMERVPDSAAVNEAVKLAGMKHMDGLKPFVNGVLRSVARYRDKGIIYPDISTQYSCPAWITEGFVRDYGEEKAKTMLQASVGERPLYFRINRARTDADRLISDLAKEGTRAEKTDLPYALKSVSGQVVPVGSESFRKGLYSVQDLSSQIAMYDLCRQIEVYINYKSDVDINVFDLCAAPGGKICFLAEQPWEGRACFRAFDISENKLEKIRENTKRLGITRIETEVKDASSFDHSLCDKADIIIADLPCSGLGVIGRKVDIKYRIKQENIISLCKLQRNILENAVKYLKPQGLMIYSVCTVTAEETVKQSEYLEQSGLIKMGERIMLQGKDSCDGFYYSLWKKTDDEGHI